MTSIAAVALSVPAQAAAPTTSAYSVVFGKPVSLVVKLPADSTGTITFSNGSTVVCDAVPVSGGAGRCSVPNLQVGSYTFTSVYSGDSRYQPSTAEVTVEVTQATLKGFAEQPVVPADGSSQLVHGQLAKFSATGIPAASTGTVTFYDNGATLCEATPSGGSASCTSDALPSGDSVVEAELGGDLDYQTTTDKVPVSVAKTQFSLQLTTTNSGAVGHPRVFTFTAGGLPTDATGVVTFTTAGPEPVTICSAVVSAGSASCEAPVAQSGSVAVQAVYGGSPDVLQETSDPVLLTVPTSATTVSIVAPVPNAPAAPNAQETFTAYVATTDTDLASIDGTVAFTIDGTAVCSAPVAQNQASCVGAVPSGGPITATYSGSDDADGSTATINGFSLTGQTSSTTTTTATTSTTTAGATTSTSTPTTTTSTAGGSTSTTLSGSTNTLDLKLDAPVGTLAAGSLVVVSGHGLKPGSDVVITLHSQTIVLGRVKVGADGSFKATLKLPSGIDQGQHHVIATGVGANDQPLTQSAVFSVDQTGHVGTPVSIAAAAAAASARTSKTTNRPTVVYRPKADKKHVVGTIAASFALLSLVGGAGAAGIAAAAGAGAGAAAGGERSHGGAHRHSEKVSSAKVKHHKLKWEGQAPGDMLWTWRLLPGWQWLDRVSKELPVKTAPPVPLSARLITDAGYLRAMIGTASLLLPVGGAVLGVATGIANGGSALPPSLGYLLAILVIGIFDGAAGFIAATAFALTVIAQGAITNAASVRMLLGVCVLWFAVPLIAGAARPFRRPVGDLDLEEVWTRLADLTISSLIGAWAAQKIIGTFSGLAGLKLPIADKANTVAIVVLVLIVVRFGLETLASFFYPERLATVTPEKIPYSTNRQRLASLVFRTALFVFVAVAYLGECWELWVGAAIFAIPQAVKIYERKFPNHEWLFKFIPGGILKTVAMLFIGRWFFELFAGHVSSGHLLSYGFVILALPAAGISMAEIVGREGPTREEGWLHQLAGVAILALGVLFVLGKAQ